MASAGLPDEIAFLAADPRPPNSDRPRAPPSVSPEAVAGLAPGRLIGWFPPIAAAAAPIGYLRNSTYCWPSVHKFVRTQYMTRPNGQYRPVSANSGMM